MARLHSPPFTNPNLYPLLKPANPKPTKLPDSGSSNQSPSSSNNHNNGRAPTTGLLASAAATETGFRGFGGACRNDVVETGDGEGRRRRRRGDSGS